MRTSGADSGQEMGQETRKLGGRLPWRQCTIYLEEAFYCDCFAGDCKSLPGEATSYHKVGNKGIEGAVIYIKNLGLN